MIRNSLVIFICLIIIGFLSCSFKKAFYDKNHKIFENTNTLPAGLGDNLDYFGQETAKDQENNQEDAPTESKPGPKQGLPYQTPEGDFFYVDQNGVRITKKNGMQVTEFPSGEIYYLP